MTKLVSKNRILAALTLPALAGALLAILLAQEEATGAPYGGQSCDGRSPDTTLTASTSTTTTGSDTSTVTGTERYRGTPEADVILGSPGPDRIAGRNGPDRICGEGGDDFVIGNMKDDRLFGGDDEDKIEGRPGADFMNGGPPGLKGGTERGRFGDECRGGKPTDSGPQPRRGQETDQATNCEQVQNAVNIDF